MAKRKKKRRLVGAFRDRLPSRRDNYNARRHAKWRAKTRYGQELSNQDLQTITKQIENGEAQFVQHELKGRVIYVVQLQDIRMAVLYQPHNQEVVSILPSDHYSLVKKGINLVDPRLAILADLQVDLD